MCHADDWWQQNQVKGAMEMVRKRDCIRTTETLHVHATKPRGMTGTWCMMQWEQEGWGWLGQLSWQQQHVQQVNWHGLLNVTKVIELHLFSEVVERDVLKEF